jgi:hypothetical protein
MANKESTPIVRSQDIIRPLRERLRHPSYAQMLQGFISNRVLVTERPSVSQMGELVVKNERHNSNTAPLRLVSSIVFSPSGVTSQVDMVALLRERPEIRMLRPRYLGTIDKSQGTTFEDIKEFVRKLGIEIATLDA